MKTIDYRQFLAIELYGGKIEIIRLKSIKRLEIENNILRIIYTDNYQHMDSFITAKPLTMDDLLEMMI